ncbi:MAG: class I SAM-dependent DNA methyltransferase [Rubrivivax sp.]|nr:class I SAM-dependent DNA methyltransferase [Rubrivivax sp.]
MHDNPMHDSPKVPAFVERWQGITGSERANYQLFVAELCRLLEVPEPEPASDDTRDNAYVFERRVTFAHGDGSASAGFIDCYRRGAFVLEAKKVKAAAQTKGFDDALMRARAQAEGYARALPAAEGRPPFLLVVDVGHVIELYAEFTRSGATYTPFPDARSHRLRLHDLHDDGVRERLRQLWLDPMALDPSRRSAKVTREVAGKLAALARELERAGHSAEHVAAFLTRCLFSMFAEDVGLLPKVGPKAAGGEGAFVALIRRHRDDPETLRQMLRVLWADMDRGGFSAALATPVLRFNGKLFKGWGQADYVLPLTREHVDGLLDAAGSNWREVEPAIFGTLLERALDPAERHALGAHYTPRAYVERLVLPTVVEPLRADWADAQAAALLLATEANALEGKKRDDKLEQARAEIRRFHHRLCTTRVLDPACGSGNFLYVTLEHLKRLEGEVLGQLEALGDTQARLGFAGETVTPQQLLGIEINERAAALAELVLWIGYLQWHIRSFGNASVAEPVIHDYGNIEHRDAVLAYDGQAPMRDEAGALVTRWDGKTFKTHPVTGEPVPDETALVPQWRYLNPRAAEWPKADFIVGNPPFIGNKRMREALGDGYVEALRAVCPAVPESADFVMYWWNHAAQLVRQSEARRFGLITTNSLTMIFNRQVVAEHRSASPQLGLAFAIPDHPWVDSTNGASVRIAMTVGCGGYTVGRLLRSVDEREGADGEVDVDLTERAGEIHDDLTVGANVSCTHALLANAGLSFMGVILVGEGFVVPSDDPLLSIERGSIRKYMNGRDLVQSPRDVYIIDFFGLDEAEARIKFPNAYQRILDRVKPFRLTVKRDSHRRDWWLFGEKRPAMRYALAGLRRYIGTTETAKHRVFSFIESDVLPDQKIRVVASDDGLLLGVLSSCVHVNWALVAGGTLEDRPVYNNTRCFEPFPFPSDDTGLTPDLTTRIRALAEQLDAHRKAQQAAHPELTLTGMYNVLEKLRRAEPLNAKDKAIHTQGLVSVLGSLHDELDAAVLAAYGWSDLQTALTDPRHTEARAEARNSAVETLLERLVALNARRAAEEAAGTVRWLRPEFQQRAQGSGAAQSTMDMGPGDAGVGGVRGEAGEAGEGAGEAPAAGASAAVAAAAAAVVKRAWPAGLPEQIKAVAEVLAASGHALSTVELEARFTARGRWRERLPTILATLEALGRARRSGPQGERWQGG